MGNDDDNTITNGDLFTILRDIQKEWTKFRADVTNEVNVIKTKIANIEQENTQLKTSEKKLRRNNICIFGFEHKNGSLTEALTKFIKDQLKINIGINDINYCYPINKNTESKIIILKLVTFHKKREILQNTRQLQGTGIYFSDDLTRSAKKRKNSSITLRLPEIRIMRQKL
ncbi:unnamed protein product [Psylliodes chrysocephalus]|uniref:Endonuclease-reverse transcriptase n=1 Tax=Psylliodes chrysocephalus TaxID=3402493 RepID=A0A9P0G6X0_9CUCU|nr:unnamed protein product [Psylliodes chrysocephala]